MTMNAMVSYLVAKGFKTTKKYIREDTTYEFTIEKDGRTLTDYFVYPENATGFEKNRMQEQFLDELMAHWDSAMTGTVKYTQTAESLKEYANKRGFVFILNTEREPRTKFTIMVFRPGHADLKQVWTCYPEDPDTHSFERAVAKLDSMMDKIRQEEEFDKQVAEYCKNDVEMTKEMWTKQNPFLNQRYGIKNVIFNEPATIVFWTDGTKTVVKCENEEYDPEKGLAMAISKKALGNQGNYYNTFSKWLGKYDEECKKAWEEYVQFIAGLKFGFKAEDNDDLIQLIDRELDKYATEHRNDND